LLLSFLTTAKPPQKTPIFGRVASGGASRSRRAPLAFSQSSYGQSILPKTTFFPDFSGLSLLNQAQPTRASWAQPASRTNWVTRLTPNRVKFAFRDTLDKNFDPEKKVGGAGFFGGKNGLSWLNPLF